MSKPITIFDQMFSDLRHMQKNNSFPNPFKDLELPKFNIRPVQMKSTNFDIQNQIQKFVKNISSSFTRLTKVAPVEDYNVIMKGFLPQNAKLIVPKNRNQLGAIHFADVDGDLQKEMVASYELNNDTTTLILKKQDGRWSKLTEIYEPKHNNIHYLGFADITGEGRKQILIGRKINDSTNMLHGYNLHSGKANKMFTRDYNRIDVVGPNTSSDRLQKKHIALWRKNSTNAYDIDLMHWNGTDLESVKNHTSYYQKRVLPFYGQRIKQEPNNPSHWYHLADSLMKVGMYRDSLMATEFGLKLNPALPWKDQFLFLKAQLREKLKKS